MRNGPKNAPIGKFTRQRAEFAGGFGQRRDGHGLKMANLFRWIGRLRLAVGGGGGKNIGNKGQLDLLSQEGVGNDCQAALNFNFEAGFFFDFPP
jgi:hypothetical protein